jgi:hypothetical protein
MNAEHGEALWLDGRVNWLLHLINARITHIDGVFHINVKILWFTLYDNLKPKPPKEKKKKETEKKETRQKIAVKKSELRKKEAQKKELQKKEQHRKEVQKRDPGEDLLKRIEQKKEALREDINKGKADKEDLKTNDAVKPGDTSDNKAEMIAGPTAVVKQVSNEKSDQTNAGGNTEQEGKEEKASVFRKVLDKIKGIKEKIRTFFSELKNKIISWFQTAVNIKHKIGLVSDFIKDKINREGFQITYRSLKRLLKHILPRKLKSTIVFGTGDPCTTGQALGAMGILYSFYGDNVRIIPDFQNKIFEGKHYARGRIRLVTVLIIVIKLVSDKRFKQLRKNFQLLKEAL